MDPNPEMPDFNRFPLPKYEPFKIFSEPKIGAGEKTLNQLRVEKYLDTSKFKQLAKDNMPFMALEIHGLQEVRYLHISTYLHLHISTHLGEDRARVAAVREHDQRGPQAGHHRRPAGRQPGLEGGPDRGQWV